MYDNIVLPVNIINEATRIKPGGLCDIVFTPWENVLTWPSVNPETGIIDDTIILKEGATLFALNTYNPSQLFTEEKKDTAAGHYHEMKIQAMLPGNLVDNILVLGTMKYHRHLIIFKDKNGEYRFLGNEDSGAKFSDTYTSGDRDSSRKRTLNFFWEHPNPAPVYQGNLTFIDPTTGGSIMFIERFKVGEAGAPMIDGQQTYTPPLDISAKGILIFAGGFKIPEFTAGITIERYLTRSGNDINFIGAVTAGEIIETYAYN